MADLETEIKVTADVSGVESGVGKAKKSLADLGASATKLEQGVAQAGDKAAKAIGSIGDGAAASGKKVGDAAAYMTAAIVKATQANERLLAGPRGSANFLEVQARQLGANTQALAPYFEGLRKSEAALAAHNAALGVNVSGLGKVDVAAKQTANSLRQVAPQVTDIVTQLAGGQAPLQVLIQQGGQLKDVFGGIGPAARALGGYVAGLVTPLTVTAVAFGGVAIAAHAGSKELQDFRKEALISGSALAGSLDRYNQLRDSLVGIAGTKGKASEALTEIASRAQLAGRNVQLIGDAAVLFEKATGQAISKTVDQFQRLADSPTQAAAELNKQFNFLTASTYAQIKALEQQGKLFEAGEVAIRAFGDTMKTRAQQVVDDAGLMERAWRGVTGAVKGAVDALKEIGRPVGLAEQLATLQQVIDRRRELNAERGIKSGAATEELQQQARELQRRLELSTGAAAAQEAANIANAQGVRAVDALTSATDKYAPKAVQAKKAIDDYRKSVEDLRRSVQIGNANGNDPAIRQLLNPATIARTEAGIRSQFTDNAGASNVAAQRAAQRVAIEENKRLLESIANLDFTTPAKLTEAEKKVIQVQEELKEALNNTARANKERELAAAQAGVQDERSRTGFEKQRDALKQSSEAARQLVIDITKQGDAISEQAAQQELANVLLGKSKTAYEQSTLALLKHQLAEADSSDTFDPKYVASLAAKVQAQERYVKALQDSEFRQKGLQLDEAARVAGEESQTLQLNLSLLGQTEEARNRILAQRKVEVDLAKQLAEIEKLNLGDGPEAAAKREELRSKARANAVVEANNATTKVVLDQWQKTSDQINSSLTDALLRGFEDGKDFAKNFRDTLANMFKTLVLRPVISAIVNPIGQSISGTVNSFLGTGGQQGGGLLGSLGSLFGGGGGIGGSAIPSAASFMNFGSGGLGSLFGGGGLSGALFGTGGGGTALATSAGALEAGALVEGVGGTTGLLGGGLSGMASFAGPLAIGGLLLSSLLKGKGETRSGGQYEGTTFVRGPSGGEIGGDQVRQSIKATQDGISAALKQLGSSVTLGTLFSGLESSTKGKGFAFAGGTLSNGQQFGQGADGLGFNNRRGNLTPEQASAAFQAELEQATLQAIQAAAGLNGRLVTETRTGTATVRNGADSEDTITTTEQLVKRVFDAVSDTAAEEASGIPKIIRDKLRGVDIDSLGDDVRKQLLAEINSIIGGVNVLKDAVATLPFENLKNLTFDAAAGLIKFAGSVESLVSNLQTYYQNFFTPAEQRVNTVKNIKRTLDAVGGGFSEDQIGNATRGQFRQVVEAFSQRTDEAGQKFYVALLSVAGAFASITPETDAAADSAADYADTLREQARALQDTIDKFGNYADALKKFRQELTLGPLARLSPEARYTATKAEFDRLSALPVNNEERLAGLQDAGKAFLDASQEYNATSTQYFMDLAKVRGAMEASEIAARTQSDIARMQLNVLQQILGAVQGNATPAPAAGSSGSGGAVFGGGAQPAAGNATGASGSPVVVTSQGIPFDLVGFINANLGDPGGIAAKAKSLGQTQVDIARLMGKDPNDVRLWFELQGIPAFRKGANRLLQDTFAVVHKDEAIIPAPFNPWAGGRMPESAAGAQSSQALQSEVVELRSEVSRLVSLMEAYVPRDVANGDRIAAGVEAQAQASALNGSRAKPIGVAA